MACDSHTENHSTGNHSPKVTVLDGMGGSNLLPRQTREHRLHLGETLSLEGRRNSWKRGGDGLLTWIYDFFPNQQSGDYLFYPIKVDPIFTWAAKMETMARGCEEFLPRFAVSQG